MLTESRTSLAPLKTFLFSFHATNTIILSYLPLYLRYKDFTETEIGWVLAIGPFASLFSQPLWGYLSDKYNTVKTMILICVISFLITGVVFFQLNTIVPILLVGAIFFFFTFPVGALADSLGQRRAMELKISFGTIRMWGSIGFAISSLLIGEVLNQVGIQFIMWPFLVFGILALLVGFKLQDVEATNSPINLKDVKKLFQSKAFIFFLILVFFIALGHRANDSFIGLYITELGGSERLVGIAWFIGVISEAAVFALAAFWFRKYPSLIFIIIAGIFYCLRWFIYAGIDQPIFVLVFQVLHGITFAVFYLAAFNYVSRIIPKNLQSTGHLLFYSVMFGLAGIIGSLVGGRLLDLFDGTVMYNVMGISAVIGTVGFIIFYYVTRNKSVEIS